MAFWASIAAGGSALAAGQELRGAWLARDSMGSKEQLAQTMDALAAARFNVVYVDCWSRGYPVWKSKVFQQETGVLGDPGFGGRDILAEAVLEGHRAGLEVEAWFEYGFNAGWDQYYAGRSGKGPIFDVHRDWLARTRSGSDVFPSSGNNFFWMIHTHPGPQQLLIDLVREVVSKYDVDGVEFDRARYPQTDCGYDEFTRQLYRQENGGQDPPADPNNSNWMRWRADKLNAWVQNLYRAVKTLRPELSLSNAPIVTPYGYVNFMQDYPAWIRDGALDLVVPQIYRRTNADYVAELQRQTASIDNAAALMYPGIDTTNPTRDEFLAMIQSTRQGGLRGFVIWYVESLRSKNLLTVLRDGPFAEPATNPHHPPDWKRNLLLLDESSPEVSRSGSWTSAAGGWQGGAVCAAAGAPAELQYRVRVPRSGWYQAAVYLTPQTANTRQAPYRLRDHLQQDAMVLVDQQAASNERWFPLGFLYLQADQSLDAVTLSNANLSPGSRVCGDAVLLLESHLEPRRESLAYRLQGSVSRAIPLFSPESELQVGSAVLQAAQGEAPSGLAVFQSLQRSSGKGNLISAAGVPAAAPLQRGLLPAEQSARTQTGLALSNPDDAAASVQLQLRSAGGVVLDDPRPVSLLLAGREQQARFLREWLGSVPDNFLGSLEVHSDRALGCLTLRGGLNERGEFVMTTMPLLDLQAPPEKQPLILPHLADGGGYRTEFWLMNPTAEEISGSAAFFDSRGAPLVLTLNGTAQSALEYRLAGYGLQRMVSAGEAAAVRSGYALLTPGSRSTAVAGSGVFSFLQAGGSRSEAGVPFTPARQGAQLFVRQAEQNGQRQIPGLAIANAGATAATLRLTLYDVTGLTVLGPSSVTLAPGEQRARFLDEWLTALPARYEGMLQIASDVPVAALGLIGYLNLSGDFIMSTLAADMPAAWNRRLLPHLATGGDYRSEIMLLPPAVSISAGALRFLTNLGRPWFVALP